MIEGQLRQLYPIPLLGFSQCTTPLVMASASAFWARGTQFISNNRLRSSSWQASSTRKAARGHLVVNILVTAKRFPRLSVNALAERAPPCKLSEPSSPWSTSTINEIRVPNSSKLDIVRKSSPLLNAQGADTLSNYSLNHLASMCSTGDPSAL